MKKPSGRYTMIQDGDWYKIIDGKPNAKKEAGRCIKKYKDKRLAQKFCTKANLK